MSGLFKAYQSILNKYPYTVQALQTGLLMGTGDVIGQTVIQRKTWSEYSFSRSMTYAAIGTFYVGPVLSRFYALMDKYIGHRKYAALMKVGIDQSTMPPLLCTTIIGLSGFIQSRPIEDIKNTIKNDLGSILLTNYKLWPMVQLVNFYFVPLYYQLLVVQTVSLIWSTYLSWKIETSKEKHQ